MEQRLIYQMVKTYVKNNSLTIEQVENATKTQIKNALNPTPSQEAELIKFWPGIKRRIIMYLEKIEYNQTLAAIKAKLTASEIQFLKQNFEVKD